MKDRVKYKISDEIICQTNEKKWLKWSVALLFLSGMIMATSAQEAMPAAGGNVSGQGGSVSFSVGQVLYTAINGEGNLVIQGVQQPYEISVVTSSDEFPIAGIEVQAYPNPATDFLILRVESEMNQHFQLLAYELLDMNGRVLEKRNISASHTNIQMGNLAPAIYFLKVYHAAKAISFRHSSSVQTKTFKIIKK